MTTVTQNKDLDPQKRPREETVYSFLSFVGPVLGQNPEAGGEAGRLGGQEERRMGGWDGRQPGGRKAKSIDSYTF